MMSWFWDTFVFSWAGVLPTQDKWMFGRPKTLANCHWWTQTHTHTYTDWSLKLKWVFSLLTEVSTQHFSSFHDLPLEPIRALTCLNLFYTPALLVRGRRAGTVGAVCVVVYCLCLFVQWLNKITEIVCTLCVCILCVEASVCKCEFGCICAKLMSKDRWWLHHLEI